MTFLGVLGAAQGAGSIAGGIVAGRLITRHGTTAVGAAGAALFALALLARCLPWWPVTVGSGFVVGEHVTRFHARSDVAYVPFHDAPPLRWGPVWHSARTTARVRALVAAALDTPTATDS